MLPWLHRITQTAAACADSIFIHSLPRKSHFASIFSPSVPLSLRLHLKIWFNLMIRCYTHNTPRSTHTHTHTPEKWEKATMERCRVRKCVHTMATGNEMDGKTHRHTRQSQMFWKSFPNGFQQQTNRLLTQLRHLMLKCIFGMLLILINWIL